MRDTKFEVLHFWFEETQPRLWFQNNPVFDETVKSRFEVIYGMAKDGLCNTWATDADGALALCIVFSQFPRKMYRNTAKAFETDEKALLVSKKAIHQGFDQVLTPEKKRFLYLPFQYSENLQDHKRALDLFGNIKEDDPVAYENAQRDFKIIEKFGRFPARNDLLQRENTPEELGYLKSA